MKLIRISFLFLLLFLLFPSVSYAQRAADKSWSSFWTKFSAAVKGKNFNVLNSLTLKPFSSSGGGYDTLPEFFQGDKNERWQWLAKSVKSGTKKYDKIDGKLSRVTKDRNLIFVYTKNEWRWWGLMGD